MKAKMLARKLTALYHLTNLKYNIMHVRSIIHGWLLQNALVRQQVNHGDEVGCGK